MTPASAPVDTKDLWKTERQLAGLLGFSVHLKVEQESTLLEAGFVATVQLRPETPRARAVCAAHRAEMIEGTQRFQHRADSVYAIGDALRTALELAKDAS